MENDRTVKEAVKGVKKKKNYGHLQTSHGVMNAKALVCNWVFPHVRRRSTQLQLRNKGLSLVWLAFYFLFLYQACLIVT